MANTIYIQIQYKKGYDTMMKLELTENQKIKLRMFLLMTTKYREGERKTWGELSKELNENGEIVFKNAVSNFDWWTDLEKEINIIIKMLQ